MDNNIFLYINVKYSIPSQTYEDGMESVRPLLEVISGTLKCLLLTVKTWTTNLKMLNILEDHTEEVVQKVHKSIINDRRLKLTKVTEIAVVSKKRAHHILTGTQQSVCGLLYGQVRD